MWKENHPGLFVPTGIESMKSEAQREEDNNSTDNNHRSSISILFPTRQNENGYDLYSLSTGSDCAVILPKGNKVYQEMQTNTPVSPALIKDMTVMTIFIHEFPCDVIICVKDKNAQCYEKLAESKVENPL